MNSCEINSSHNNPFTWKKGYLFLKRSTGCLMLCASHNSHKNTIEKLSFPNRGCVCIIWSVHLKSGYVIPLHEVNGHSKCAIQMLSSFGRFEVCTANAVPCPASCPVGFWLVPWVPRLHPQLSSPPIVWLQSQDSHFLIQRGDCHSCQYPATTCKSAKG